MYYLLLLIPETRMIMKKGAPKNEVIIPTGISAGEIIVLEIISAKTRKTPPKNVEEIINNL